MDREEISERIRELQEEIANLQETLDNTEEAPRQYNYDLRALTDPRELGHLKRPRAF